MHLLSLLNFLLLVLLQVEGKSTGFEQNCTIFVGANGTLNETCQCESDLSYPCASLVLALQGAKNFSGSVKIVIETGRYSLTESVLFDSKTGLGIFGNDDAAQVVIECQPFAGIAFKQSNNIIMENLSFVGCGARHLSTSMNFSSMSSHLPHLHFQVALLFLLSEDITISHLIVRSSNGTGIALMNTIGDIVITDSLFANNTANGTGNLPGGGGIYIEFSKCISPNFELGLLNPFTSNSTYILTNNHFLDNEASTGEFDATHQFSRPDCGHQFSFGKGGGLAVFFKDDARHNHINVTNSSFKQNRAKVGAGLLVSIENGSQNNSVKVASTLFVSNECYKQVVPPSSFSTGGGAGIFFLLYLRETITNYIVFEYCNFTNNFAYQGGGIAILSTSVASALATTNTAVFKNCTFERNIGRVGAAVNIFHWLSLPNATREGYSALPSFENCMFCENGGTYKYLKGNVTGRTFATVYVEGIPTHFSGPTLYYRNTGSALVAQTASIEFASNANVSFIGNQGRIGGAVAILGNSWIVVCEGTMLAFSNNSASEKGGAIFAIQTEQHSIGYSHTCFIRYIDPYLPPQNWTSKFVFSNNTAFNHRKNSIHISSLLPCTWPHNSSSPIEYDMKQTFCNWKGWKFKDLKRNSTCADEILTSPVKLSKNTMERHPLEIFPGKSKPLHVKALDELHHDVTNQTIFTVSFQQPSTSVNLKLLYISDDSLAVYGPPNTDTTISLEAFDTIAVSMELNLSIQTCPPGFVYNNTEKKCNCGGGFKGLVQCRPEAFQSYLFLGCCISFSEIDGYAIASRCPFSLGYQESMELIPLPMSIYKLNDSFCGSKKLGRRGRLCSQCKVDHGVAVFSRSFKCVECTESYKHWLRFFAIEFVPLTIIFLIVFTFHISITSPATNAFIFFSQVISLPFEVLLISTGWTLWLGGKEAHKPAHALSDIAVFPYSIWNLDFSFMSGPNFCLSRSFSVVHILALQYISAVYPLLLALIAFIIIELHARNFRPIVCLWKPLCLIFVRFRRTWQPKTSVIDAFATFILLSYTKFVQVSFSLLTPTRVFNDSGMQIELVLRYDPSIHFFGPAHLPYAILAIVVLLTFGAIPPTLFLLYPYRRIQRFLNRHGLLQSPALQMFIDTFQGCYKDGTDGKSDCRCFAGLYFVFRIAVFIIYTSFKDDLLMFFFSLEVAYVCILILFAIFHPYKQQYFNCLDVLVVALLTLINSMMLYSYVYTKTSHKLPHNNWIILYVLLFLPLLYMVGYVVYRSVLALNCCKTHCTLYYRLTLQRSTSDSQLPIQNTHHRREHLTSLEIPDRVENPQRYQEMSWSMGDTGIGSSLLQESTDADEHTSLTMHSQMNPVTNYGSSEPTY